MPGSPKEFLSTILVSTFILQRVMNVPDIKTLTNRILLLKKSVRIVRIKIRKHWMPYHLQDSRYTPSPSQMSSSSGAHAGQAVYTARTLKIYDLLVLGISNRWIWKCPTAKLLEFYNQHITANHLDVGVGTGYFLDRCSFPNSEPRIELLDFNPNSLASTARRINRYQPVTHQANVLEPLQLETEAFDSIGLNYLLHCVPGKMAEKVIAFDHLNARLKPGGTVFGSTLVQGGVQRNPAARMLMALYNRKGIFCNEADSLDSLRSALAERYETFHITSIGCAALFTAQQPK